MSDKFQPIDRDTLYLFPPSMQEWLPEEHLARFVIDIVDQLDLRELEAGYGGGGKQPYHPALLLSLLFYGYATGVFSSRKLEQATYDSVAFRYIAANQHPDHDTIAHFRRRFLKELESLFVQILVLAKQMGLFKLGKVSLDGTKIKANASKHKAMSWRYAQKLEEQMLGEVKELLKRAEEVDEQEAPEINIPAELARREQRLAAIKRAQQEIKRRAGERFKAEKAEYEAKLKARKDKQAKSGKKAGGREPKPPEEGPRDKDQMNFTDEESRIMPSSEGFVQAYNAQAAVDNESHLIVTHHVTQQTNDKREVVPTLKSLEDHEAELGRAQGLLADAGYYSADNVEECDQANITSYISNHREAHNVPLGEPDQGYSRCPEDADAVTKMAHRMNSAEGRSIYSKRKSTVEPVFGVIKHVMGFRRFHLRGFNAVRGEWNLVCMAWNLKRLHALAA